MSILKKEITDLLKGDPYVSSIDPSLLVFLATLVRFGYTERVHQVDGKSKEWIVLAINKKNGLHPELVAELYKVFENSFQTLTERTLVELILLFNKQKELNEFDFTLFIERLIELALDDFARSPVSYTLPSGLKELMSGLAKIRKEVTYNAYIPFSATGDLLIKSTCNISFDAQEINLNNWAISKIRALFNECPSNTSISNVDPIDNWNLKSKKYDLVFSVPPFGLKIGERQAAGKFGYFRSIEQFIIEKGVESLKQDGRLILTIPQGFLFNSDNYSRQLKRFLIDENYLEAVISLPKGIFAFTNILTAVLVIHKSNKPKQVKFIDGSTFVKKEGKFNLVDYQSILRLYDSEETANFIKLVSINEIAENDYNLSVSRYVTEAAEGTPLKEIVSTIRGNRTDYEKMGKVVKIKNLKNTIADYILHLDEIEVSEITQRHRQLNQSCVLIAARFKACKPTYFEYQGEPIYIDNNVFAIIPDENKVRIDYFIYLLHTTKVVAQIESLQSGAVTPFISPSDFLRVKVDLPNYEDQSKNLVEQKKIVTEATISDLEKISLNKSLTGEIERLKLQYNEELREKQHCIRQHLKNVVDSIAVINAFMAKQNGTINSEDVINPNRNITVAQRFLAMGNSIRSLSLEIDNLTNDELYDKPELVSIRDLLSECILEFGDTKGFSIQENFDEVAFSEFGNTNPQLSVSKRSFKELFNNILMNASTHGFVEKKDYVIRINVTIENDKLILSFLNNGKPFAEGMSKQLGVKGKKAGINAGNGIGVWKIFEIAKQYNFDCSVIDAPEDEFPVGWEFKFTLTEMN